MNEVKVNQKMYVIQISNHNLCVNVDYIIPIEHQRAYSNATNLYILVSNIKIYFSSELILPQAVDAACTVRSVGK